MEKGREGLEETRMSERVLVDKILKGDKGAFERFYKKHRPELKRFMVMKVGDWQDAEELLQDTFLSFLDSLPLFRYKSSLKTFLWSIARHEVLDYYRRRYAKRALKYVPIFKELVDEKLYSTRELSNQIDKVYKKIGREYTRLLELKYEEEMSVKQIARKLKLSVKAVESKLFRARRVFQKKYTELRIMNYEL